MVLSQQCHVESSIEHCDEDKTQDSNKENGKKGPKSQGYYIL